MGASAGLYSSGGVWVWVRVGQGVVLPTAGEGVERVKWGEASHGAGDHGYGVWRHERDVVWWAPHGQSIVRWACSPQNHVVRVQGVADPPAVSVQVRVLLHLQRHDFLLLSVGKVIGGTPLGATASVNVVPALVLLVVECSKGQDVQEKKGRSHSDGYWQLSGVVTLVHKVGLVVAVLGFSGEGCWVWALGHQDFGLWCTVSSLWWRDLKTGNQRLIQNLFDCVQPYSRLRHKVQTTRWCSPDCSSLLFGSAAG